MNRKEEIRNHFNTIAQVYDLWKAKNSYYYSSLKRLYKRYIPPDSSVIEFGCATADILASCLPKRGVGIDISDRLIEQARCKYPQYDFVVADAEVFESKERFEYAIMSDLLDHVVSIPGVIDSCYKALIPGGKLICTTINPLWNPVMTVLERFKLKMPEGPHSFVPNRLIELLCQLKGFRTLTKEGYLLIPKRIPFVSDTLNRIAPFVPLLRRLCWVQVLVAEKHELPVKRMGVSVVIPVYNEEKNIEKCISRIPPFERECEIIVVDDYSQDNTLSVLKELGKRISNLKIITCCEHKGKACAVEQGIKSATKEAVVILDADMAVAPEDINLFLEPLENGIAEFVNGTRFIYNMEKNAMSQIRRIGNFLFALIFSHILRINLTDTLCGTKSFFRRDFQEVKLSEEKWGDFILIAWAKQKRLRITEVPVRYHIRQEGKSKMKLLPDGLRFLVYMAKMAFVKKAARIQ